LPEEKPVENTPPQKVTESPVVQQSTVSDGGSAAPSDVDISSVISKPKKKFGGGKIIATILGLFVLIGGVGAGIVLTQEPQLLQQKAATNTCSEQMAITCGNNGEHCEADLNGGHCVANPTPAPTATTLACTAETVARCHAMSPSEDCQANASGGQCVATPKPAPTATTLACTAETVARCHAMSPSEDCQANASGGLCVPKTIAPCTGTDSCIPDNTKTDCEQVNGVWDKCIIYVGDMGYSCSACNGVPASSTPANQCSSGHYCDTYPDCISNTHCDYQPKSCTPDSTCGSNNIPTPTPPSLSCTGIKAFKGDNTTSMTSDDLSSLQVGDSVTFCAYPSAARGTFTVNGVATNEIGSACAPAAGVPWRESCLCMPYTVPSGVSTFNVSAVISN
jgi:hypothetical protein